MNMFCKLGAASLLALLLAFSLPMAQAQQPVQGTGVQPEQGVLLINEADGQAQMSLKSGDARPLLLHSRIYDVVEEDKSLVVVPLPTVVRVEPQGRQIVRFALSKSEPLKVQHIKRVTFEGIPPSQKKEGEAKVNLNVRYDLPVIISPKGLVQHEAPWELMKWSVAAGRLTMTNPSPYIVRLSREVDLQPQGKRIEIFKRTFALPGETLSVELPKDVKPADIKAVRLFPANLWGYTAPDYDAPLEPTAP
ncbi:MAG: fimbria/pilus periplasmic chaperone [Burkholderiales bacterium]|nr:fimbria/pilus periplasmic chaperone [Burkholderiales bacterium]